VRLMQGEGEDVPAVVIVGEMWRELEELEQYERTV
jgi:hypothetical protein